jgi:acyl-CoA synthetase (AMP-forming)/AMP-acid ligase II
VIAVDALPDSVGSTFTPVAVDSDDIAYLQYTSGSTRTPAGVEISHRAVCTNVVQMIIAGGLDTKIRSVSWLPLYHDMGLLMIMFPALCGGYITLMSPLAFVRRPHRWIKQLAAEAALGRTFAAAPNFAYDLAAQRGLPPEGESLDLSNVVGLLNGSEPVTMGAIERFTEAFAPYGLPPTAIKPSYGMAEATLSVATIAPDARATAIHLDRKLLADGRAVVVTADAPQAVPQVSCGQVIIGQWAVIADGASGAELPDGRVGEIWLHGDNIGAGYWGRDRETELVFKNKLQSRLESASHADGSPSDAFWLRTGDLGVYLDGELYITGRIKDLIIIDGRNHHPQDLEATIHATHPTLKPGRVAAFSVPSTDSEHLIIVVEHTTPDDPTDTIRAAIKRHHDLRVHQVLLTHPGTIQKTTSGKLARHPTRTWYLNRLGLERG